MLKRHVKNQIIIKLCRNCFLQCLACLYESKSRAIAVVSALVSVFNP